MPQDDPMGIKSRPDSSDALYPLAKRGGLNVVEDHMSLDYFCALPPFTTLNLAPQPWTPALSELLWEIDSPITRKVAGEDPAALGAETLYDIEARAELVLAFVRPTGELHRLALQGRQHFRNAALDLAGAMPAGLFCALEGAVLEHARVNCPGGKAVIDARPA